MRYDEHQAFNLFIQAKLPEDLNCRVAAWNLIKDQVSVTPDDGELEYAEQCLLAYYPYTGFKEGDKEAFWGIFKGIPAQMIGTTKGYIKVIQEAWQERAVAFTESPRKLITCFSYSLDNKWLEAVHAGIMIEEAEGILFIEKWNPKAPFQVSRFKNERQLKYYLEQRLKASFVLQPIIMKNDQPL